MALLLLAVYSWLEGSYNNTLYFAAAWMQL